jgi:type II secretory pathway pseudopilin PulG
MTSRGFSLVETVFAMTVLSLVGLFVLNLFPTASLAVHRAAHELQAEALAQSVLEEMRATPFAAHEPDSSSALPRRTVEGVDYHPVLEVYVPAGEDAQHLKGLRVTVRWEYARKAHIVAHEAWIANLPR